MSFVPDQCRFGCRPQDYTETIGLASPSGPASTRPGPRYRLREARSPEIKTLDTFDFTAADGLTAAQVHTLARDGWIG